MEKSVDISVHREKAFQRINEMHEKYGHFPILEHYPKKGSDWFYTHPSPFLHANVLYSLLNSGSIVPNTVIVGAGKFLWEFKEIGNIWRFWKNHESTNPVLCGTEDTAISSIVLEKLGYTLKNKEKLVNRIKTDGSLYTWIVADKKLLFNDVKAYLWLKYNDRPAKDTIQRGYMSLIDSEPTITATVISYLGENEQTHKTINYLKSAWDSWEKPFTGVYDYYEQKIVFAFHIARAYKEGCLTLKDLLHPIVEYIDKEYERFEFAELLIAYLSLTYYQCEHYLLDILKGKILSEISVREAYFDHYKYISSNDREYFGGSNVLTAAWFLETTNNW